MNNEYSLYHFGVKGMKWGHRRQKRKEEKEALRAKRKDQLERWKKDPELRKEVRKKKAKALRRTGAHMAVGGLKAAGLAVLNDALVVGLVNAGKPTVAKVAHLTVGVAGQIVNEASTYKKVKNEFQKARDW